MALVYNNDRQTLRAVTFDFPNGGTVPAGQIQITQKQLNKPYLLLNEVFTGRVLGTGDFLLGGTR